MNIDNEIKYHIVERLKHLKSIGLGGIYSGDGTVVPSSSVDAKTFSTIEEVFKSTAICEDCELCKNTAQRLNSYGALNDNAKIIVLLNPESLINDDEREQLSKIITGGLKLDMDKDVYVTSTVKCLPATDEAIEDKSYIECIKYLQAEVSIVKPKVIMAFGEEPAKVLIDFGSDLNTLRGRAFDALGVKTVATYSLKSLLEDSELKKGTWQDLQIVLELIN